MKFLALAVLLASPAHAAVIELVPAGWRPAPLVAGLTTADASARLPLLPALSAPALAELPKPLLSASGVNPWTPGTQVVVSEARRETVSPATARAADPAASESLVRDLLARLRDEGASRESSFDGSFEKTPVESFPDAHESGAVLQTRGGAYTLAWTKSKSSRDGTITVFERWNGADGKTAWVRRKRGPDTWDVSEWHGKLAPLGFEPDGLALPAAHYAEFNLMSNGRLGSNIETKSGPDKPFVSAFVDAKKSFAAALAWFGDKIGGIKGTWVYGDNLAEFNRLTGLGMTPEEAALATWTGERAAKAGYTKVVFSPEMLKHLREAKPGEYKSMAALFLKP